MNTILGLRVPAPKAGEASAALADARKFRRVKIILKIAPANQSVLTRSGDVIRRGRYRNCRLACGSFTSTDR
jgi:hypothetical protein